MIRGIYVLMIMALPLVGMAQKDTLPEVVVQGFASGQRLSEAPSAIGYLTEKDLQRTQGTSLLPAMNTIPGVRMEERSPQSYRLSIRGSLLRSPFGVRNVKIYWDDMPLTDAGGNTYINVLDMNTFQSIEVLKGPGGSMYGANTGGVVLFHGDTSTGSRVQLRGGSYNQWGEDAMGQARYKGLFNAAFQSHSQADGYRDHSASHKDTYQDWGHIKISKNDQLDWLGLYTDLFYQTPGGLTAAQLAQNPKAARPNSPTIPGAVQQQAAIYAQTWFAGLTNRYDAGGGWTNATTVLASGTHFDNPFLTDYEQRRELTLDALTRWIYDRAAWRVVLGAEYQYTRSFIHDWGNSRGTPDTTQSYNKLEAFQFLPYAQAEWRFAPRWLVQAGMSVNTFQYHYTPLIIGTPQRINLDAQVLPRLSLQYVFVPGVLSVYTTVSQGYSPPTIAEIFPGTALLYNHLQPEEGWNYEFGVKGYFLQNLLQVTLAAYEFRLRHTITPRYDSAGHAYYVNAGNTSQKGVEAQVTAWLHGVRVFASYALQDYHFTNNTEVGHPLTGVPGNVLVLGADAKIKWGVYVNTTFTYTDKLPLDDASDAWAGSYDLWQAKLGWERKKINVFAGMDNILNQVYSLGNDLNAAGGRYYNTAPGRNVFAGCSVRIP
ncbi:iron complex outermembrane receptor protein [Dinghuibacter silviterrae]|uniref:Iron complex outermembrane receptor protein n=2 Tax=Dinghuibacter silviterrae TaxID=1539049 RepID=A0A4R8DTT7_9BACT|nr:iron complex outermembrane receptor protein [Dinghuibacter silviterrae]